jgi:hypothetical protein
MQEQKSVINFLESLHVHGHRFRLTIMKEYPFSPIEFSLPTTINKTRIISTFNREECLAQHETRKTCYSDLRMAMAISSSQFLPICTIPVPTLDRLDTILSFMCPEEWDVECIVAFE